MTKLTARGWAMLASAAGLALGGVVFGVLELYPLAAAAAVLVLGSWWWVSASRWDVRPERTVRPPRVPAGVEARVELAFRNHARRRSPLLLARDPYEGTGRAAELLIAPMMPGELRQATFRLPTSKRGRFRLGPMEMQLRDPFGLAFAARQSAPAAVLTVHPLVERIRPDTLPEDARGEAVVPVPARGRMGDDFYGLRHYEEGDDLRRIHWASTARFDELMVREPETLWKGRLSVIVDMRTSSHDARTVEAALSAAASVTVAACRVEAEVRLLTTAGVNTGFCQPRTHGAPVLDALAAVQPHGGGSLLASLNVEGRLGPSVLLTTSSATDAELGAVVRRGGRAQTTIVMFERSATKVGRRVIAGGARVVSVPAGISFHLAWDRVARC